VIKNIGGRKMKKQELLDDAMFDQSIGEFDGKCVNDLSELPHGYKGLALHVNDHGNVSLYKVFKNGNCHLVVDRV
jgi:hypothetical protein